MCSSDLFKALGEAFKTATIEDKLGLGLLAGGSIGDAFAEALASGFEKEIDERTADKKDITEGIERFIYGLGKKVLLSNYLAFIADTIFAADSRSVAATWLGGICYTLQMLWAS